LYKIPDPPKNGVIVTIYGTGFGEATFDGTLCGEPLSNCIFSDDGSEAVCETPEVGTSQICEFVFIGPDGNRHQITNQIHFDFSEALTPTISSISPKMGGSMGGTS